MRTKHVILAILLLFGVTSYNHAATKSRFVQVQGKNLISPDGSKLFIKGTNLGHWLNPEGYMFNFDKTNCPRTINEMLCELVGPDFTAQFWKAFKDNYVTREDIQFIAKQGANTIRVPFNYRLFTDEDYMGLTDNKKEGFTRMDSLVKWCKEANLYMILDMHDAPGGQTGDNIDDGYGYPWLMESEASQKLFCEVWRKVANHYKDEPIILGYDILNEPIAPYFDMDKLNPKLEGVYKMGVAAIREVDNNHVVMLGGAQWDGNFKPFKDTKFDSKMMYTCHRYGGEPTKAAIQSIISFRDSVNLPMYMGEIGHNTPQWQSDFCKTMKDNNIGYTFWPYKKMDGSSFVGVTPPANWDVIVKFAEASRSSFKEIRDARPDQAQSRKILLDYLEACKLKNCVVQTEYINSLLLKGK